MTQPNSSMCSDIVLENELTNCNSDYTEWYAVLCHYAISRSSTVDESVCLQCYAAGLTPAEALDGGMKPNILAVALKG
jgi:hypothetical protein